MHAVFGGTTVEKKNIERRNNALVEWQYLSIIASERDTMTIKKLVQNFLLAATSRRTMF